MLTGLHPHEHGVSREWQPFPLAKDSLPGVLARNGWHTLFAPSSLELSGRNNYLDQVFAEVVADAFKPDAGWRGHDPAIYSTLRSAWRSAVLFLDSLL